VLAWSCGGGRHLFAFADVGIIGIGADTKPMIAFARRLAGPRRFGTSGKPDVTFVRADLDEKPRVARALLPVDLSFVPLSSVHTLKSPRSWRSTSRSLPLCWRRAVCTSSRPPTRPT
jgi:hypothetical protein